jgi:cholesterol oxidase
MEPATAAVSPGVLAPPEIHGVPTSDGTEIRLTHYALGDKGPIVLAPGYGNAARAFALDTVPKSLVSYLGDNGYDIWLLDYRASPDLPSSRTQFTVDDIATRDWPAAIDFIRAETGSDSVQALAHCVGGLSLFMALGSGMEGVRSATFSALAGNPIPTLGNQARAQVRLATLFKKLGIGGLDTAYDPSSLPDKAIETVMRVLPYRKMYDSPTGRRIYFIYGDVFDTTRIDERTMEESVPSFFGNGNITFFEHMSLMIRKGRAVDARGGDVYLPNTDRYKMPITFITGLHNRMFVPKGLRQSYEHLSEANGGDDYRHIVMSEYAHLDLWLGEDSAEDVFPIVLSELERQDS